MPYQRLFMTLANLPVLSLAYDIQQFLDDPTKQVLIVKAAPGSGKTLCVPILVAEHRPSARIVVLEPNKFIAGEAVEDILELTKLPQHNTRVSAAYVGDSTDTSVSVGMKRRTAVTYSTYAYALNNALVETADVVVADEAQDKSLDQTATLSIIRKRLDNQHPIKLIIMSATMVPDEHEADWDAYGTVTLQTDEHMHPCRDEWIKPSGRFGARHDELGDQVLRLHHEGCRGILVFVDTMSDVDGVKRYLEQKDAVARQFDIHVLVGRTTYADRCAIRAFPKPGLTRVLIGTRVLEAGLNFAWADAAVSTGIGADRELNSRTMTIETVRRPLCQHRLEHQRGRVARFCPGRFVLLHQQSFTDRPVGVVPEVHRLPLDALVLHCASLGLVATQLDFVPAVDADAVADAQEQLIACGVVTEKQLPSGKGSLQLTKMGRIAQRVGLSLISGLMLQEAARLKLLHFVIPLIATYEIGDVRLKRVPEWTVGVELSDVLTQLLEYCAAHEVYQRIAEQHGDRRLLRVTIKEEFTDNNWSVKLYLQTQNLIRRLERELSVPTDYSAFSDTVVDDSIAQLRQVLLASSLHQLFELDCKAWRATSFATGVRYPLDQNSVVRYAKFQPNDVVYVTGVVREIVPRNGKPAFSVLGGVSYYMDYELAEMVDARTDWLVETRVSGGQQNVLEVCSRMNGRVLFRYRYDRHNPNPISDCGADHQYNSGAVSVDATDPADDVDPREALRRHFQRV